MTIQDMLLSRLIVESLAKNGKVTLEEAQFYNRFTADVLTKIAETTIEEMSVATAAAQATQNETKNKSIEESETSSIVKKLLK
jgi:hypothetical protein